jgi:sugar O-acyltransferase (sialic acid O-acetyltransferase NeuD family)
MKRALIGNGGFAKDIKALMGDQNILCFVDDKYYNFQKGTEPLSTFNPFEYELLVSIANPRARAEIISRLPRETKFFSVIHPSAQLLVRDGIKIGVGCVISANCLLVDGISIGDHCQLNLGTILGHDVTIGNYFTCAPGVKIMGNNVIGNYVYFGTNACSKEKITVVDDVTVGLNAGVISNLLEPGTYVGTPARRIK